MDDASSARRKASGDYHHGDLRAALIAGALEMIGPDGTRAVSLRALARHVGVSTAAPYRHFDSRQALLAAVAEQGFVELVEQIRAAVAEHLDEPLIRLREAGVAYVRFAVDHPPHYAVMFSGELLDRSAHPALDRAAKAAFAELTQAIDAGQRAGLLRPDDPAALTALSWSVVHGLSWLISSGQGKALGLDPDDVEGLGRFLGDRLIEGIGAR